MEPQEFGAFIQLRRKELGLSQAQLAEKLHVTAKAVSRWERGVGFPDIKLLQPLADALEITLIELMQSRRIEEDIPKETAAQMVSETVDTIQRQGELSLKRKLMLFLGNGVFLATYLFLGFVAREYVFEPRWVGYAIAVIGVFIWHWGSRALYCLMTGMPFFEKTEVEKNKTASAVFLISAMVLLCVVSIFSESEGPLRDLLFILSAAALVGSGMLLY